MSKSDERLDKNLNDIKDDTHLHKLKDETEDLFSDLIDYTQNLSDFDTSFSQEELKDNNDTTKIVNKDTNNESLKKTAQAHLKDHDNKDLNVFNAKAFLKTVPNRPGCYRMYDIKGCVIYVGKAKDLKKRLSSYFLKNVNSVKTKALVSNIASVEFSVTFSETEALILENNLIKQYQPRYNILLRDDKSYPYLFLSTKQKHPGLYYHRGPKKIEGEYFGPYPDSSAVKDSLRLIQKLFPIRQCTDTVYANRSRPCLMAQIGKCLAPCVAMTDRQEQNYQRQVNLVKLFLKGQNQELLNTMTEQMQELSKSLQFEEAAIVRDQILALRRVQESQSVASDNIYNIDVIACGIVNGLACVHILFIRDGRILGTRSYYPKMPKNIDTKELLSSFLEQFYLAKMRDNMLPNEIVIDEALDDVSVLQDAIYEIYDKKIKIVNNVREAKLKYLKLAKANVEASLKSKGASSSTAKIRIEALEKLLNIKNVERMECFDISHTLGENTVASCVVFNREGPDTSRYRRFNITGITPGDDFAAMHDVLTRRYKDPSKSENPDIIFIDGGKGQLSQAEEVISKAFTKAQMKVPLIVGVAKGEGRKEGLETLIVGFSRVEYVLGLSDPALQLVIHIRDESHRFAITGHRAKRAKARRTSALENIQGVGAKRRKALLEHLGGRREIIAAGVDELAKVPGISKELAKKIYDSLHDIS